ncbi:MAG: hypothetical protein K2J73_12465 [Oscillospiraceae bacterium]|nr:hypothetical protein [Oscillospiraceae bacterium]
MKKKTLGRVAAASLAAMTAVSAMSITASADIGYDTTGKINGTVYQVTTTTGGGTDENGVPVRPTTTTAYYINLSSIPQGSSYTTVNVTTAFGYGANVYVKDGVISKTNTAGSTALVTTTAGQNTSTPGYSYQYASSTNNVYLGTNGKYYPNLSSLYASGTSLAATKKPDGLTYGETLSSSASGLVYFDRDTGTFSSVPIGDYVQILGYSSNYDYNDYNKPSNYDTYDVYKVGNTYYPTLSSALAAAANNYSLITKIYDYSRPQTNYFSKTTGRYYATYADALKASGNSSSNVYTFSYYTNDNYYDYLYGYGYGYADPYYYYWLDRQNNKNDDTTSSTSDSTTASVGNRKGWTAVAKYLGSLKNGSSVTVSMNNETSIPSSVTSAIKGKNITVRFTLKNGVVFAINGNDISTASSIDIDTAYNTNMVPTKLVKAAYKKNDAVSSAQITISGGSFGADADVTVKFATKRAGCTAKLYRYNAARETLSLVSTAKVQSTGKCTFGDVDQGGNFVITLS